MPQTYPASCNFMVAQPPSYEESIGNLSCNDKTPILTKPKKKIKHCIIL